LHERIDAILCIVDDTDGDAIKADEAEERVAQEARKMGHDALQAWAERKLVRVEAEYEESPLYKRREKKALLAHPVRRDSGLGTTLSGEAQQSACAPLQPGGWGAVSRLQPGPGSVP